MDESKEQPASVPPPAVGGQRVLHYAVLDDSVGFTSGHGLVFINRKELWKVPCLAICENPDSEPFMLHYCDQDWNSLGISPKKSVLEAKKSAERIFPGSTKSWVEAHFTPEEVAGYLGEEDPRFSKEALARMCCSFCGKKTGNLSSTIFGSNNDVWICGECVMDLYKELNERSSPE